MMQLAYFAATFLYYAGSSGFMICTRLHRRSPHRKAAAMADLQIQEGLTFATRQMPVTLPAFATTPRAGQPIMVGHAAMAEAAHYMQA